MSNVQTVITSEILAKLRGLSFREAQQLLRNENREFQAWDLSGTCHGKIPTPPKKEGGYSTPSWGFLYYFKASSLEVGTTFKTEDNKQWLVVWNFFERGGPAYPSDHKFLCVRLDAAPQPPQ